MPVDRGTQEAAYVSYNRQDCDFALRLVTNLKAAGASVWLDQEDILPGRPQWMPRFLGKKFVGLVIYRPSTITFITPQPLHSCRTVFQVGQQEGLKDRERIALVSGDERSFPVAFVHPRPVS